MSLLVIGPASSAPPCCCHSFTRGLAGCRATLRGGALATAALLLLHHVGVRFDEGLNLLAQ